MGPRAKRLGSGHPTEADSGGGLRTPRIARRFGSREASTAAVPVCPLFCLCIAPFAQNLGCPPARERSPGYWTVAVSDSYHAARGIPLGTPAPISVRVLRYRCRYLSLGGRCEFRPSARKSPERVQIRLLRGPSKHDAVLSSDLCCSGSRYRLRARLHGDRRPWAEHPSVCSDGTVLCRTPAVDLARIGRPTNPQNSHSGAAPGGQGRNSLLILTTKPRLLRSQPRSGLRPPVTSR